MVKSVVSVLSTGEGAKFSFTDGGKNIVKKIRLVLATAITLLIALSGLFMSTAPVSAQEDENVISWNSVVLCSTVQPDICEDVEDEWTWTAPADGFAQFTFGVASFNTGPDEQEVLNYTTSWETSGRLQTVNGTSAIQVEHPVSEGDVLSIKFVHPHTTPGGSVKAYVSGSLFVPVYSVTANADCQLGSVVLNTNIPGTFEWVITQNGQVIESGEQHVSQGMTVSKNWNLQDYGPHSLKASGTFTPDHNELEAASDEAVADGITCGPEKISCKLKVGSLVFFPYHDRDGDGYWNYSSYAPIFERGANHGGISMNPPRPGDNHFERWYWESAIMNGGNEIGLTNVLLVMDTIQYGRIEKVIGYDSLYLLQGPEWDSIQVTHLEAYHLDSDGNIDPTLQFTGMVDMYADGTWKQEPMAMPTVAVPLEEGFRCAVGLQGLAFEQVAVVEEAEVANNSVEVLEVETAEIVDDNVYVVQEGDALERIARDHGLTLDQILDLNPEISNPGLILIGQSINVG